jgi:hypothetical protein
MQRGAERSAEPIDHRERPRLLADRVDHQRVALIMAYGLALPSGRQMIRMGHVHAHVAHLMVR